MSTEAIPADTLPASQSAQLVAILVTLAGQIRGAMEGTHAPMETLVKTTHAMDLATQVLVNSIMDFSSEPHRVFDDLRKLHDDLYGRSTEAVTAIQFHDRHIQILTHVCDSLSFVADAIMRNRGVITAADWGEINTRVRGMLSMEQERALFDRISQVASFPESHPSATGTVAQVPTVELF